MNAERNFYNTFSYLIVSDIPKAHVSQHTVEVFPCIVGVVNLDTFTLCQAGAEQRGPCFRRPLLCPNTASIILCIHILLVHERLNGARAGTGIDAFGD